MEKFLTGGISYLDEKTNLIIHGGIDDLWFDLNKKNSCSRL